mmetsp:Transcript_12029/g.18062  ORF Transcript_12029/g.18062 Transcript_12029/m.18062 type:complete len:393 (+) Transcript_12029:20-1198(+)
MRNTRTLSKLALFLVTSSTRVQSTSAYTSKRSLSAFVRNSNNRIKIDSTVVANKPRKIQTTSRSEQAKNKSIMSMSTSSASSLPMNESTGNTRVALLQFKVTEDKLQNHATASSYLKKAHEKGASLTVLPEIWNSPYATTAFAEYAEKLPDIDYQYEPQAECSIMQESPSAKLLFDAATTYNMYIIGGSIPELYDGKIYNTCLCISPSGKLIGKHRKVHLFDIDVPGGIRFMESDTLAPGNTLTAFSAGESFGNIGVGICYDIRFPEYALLLTKKYKCNLIVYPGAFNMTTGPAHWELLQKARAVDNQCFVLTASPARTEEPKEGQEGKYKHYTAWGHSTVINPWGEVVGTCGSDEDVVVVDLELGDVSKMRQGIPTASQKRDDLYKLVDGK